MTTLSDLYDTMEKWVHEEMRQTIIDKSREFLQTWLEHVSFAVKQHVIVNGDKRSFYVDVFDWDMCDLMTNTYRTSPLGDICCWCVMMRNNNLREPFIDQLRKLVDGKYETIKIEQKDGPAIPIIRVSMC